jgi:simple sugar transport system permease protein
MSVRFQRLPSASPALSLVSRVAAIGLALSIAGFIAVLTGMNPLWLVVEVVTSTFGSSFGLQDLGVLATPLILTGLSVMIARRMGLWNIGAEGQFYAGALAATSIGLFVDGPTWIILPAMFVAGAAGGLAWIALPAIARAYADVNELITTLLLNFVATLLVYYVGTGPWRDRGAGTLGSTPRIPYEVPELWGLIHWGLVIALVLTLLVAAVFSYTRWGYEVRVSGANPDNARYAGIGVKSRIVAVMLLSGAVAGVAGMLEVAGTVHRLQGGISNNFGYLGIIVAVLAGRSCLAVIGTAVLMAFILNSGIILQTLGVTTSAVVALTGLVLLFTAMGEELARYRPVRTTRKADGASSWKS